LFVSMLGYANYKQMVRNIDLNKPVIFALNVSPVLLKEVVVEATAVSANDIFKKAYERLKNNFPQSPFCLKGFYRQISSENDKSVLLVEAAVEIYDKKYQLQHGWKLQEKVVVGQVRSSDNYFEHKNENYFDQSNTLSWLLRFNFTRYENRYVMERNNFELDSIQYLNGRLVYSIHSTSASVQLTNCFSFLIDAENFSFLKIKNENIANKGYHLQNFDVPINGDKSRVLKLTGSSQTYQFKAVDGKMFLEHAIGYTKGQIIDLKTSRVERELMDENLLVVNEIVTVNTHPPSDNLMDPGQNIGSMEKLYDSNFWKDDDKIKLSPLTKKQRADLEKKLPLSVQFKRINQK
jgi:hypothetical protein